MKKNIFRLFIAMVFLSCLGDVAQAQAVSSSELISNAKVYDGKTVVYTGEAIGELMVRGDYAWVNLNDGQNAIGIWLSKSLGQEINYAGSYKAKGDWMEVTGVFQRACVLHGGDLDIHAQAVRKISSGRPSTEFLNTGKRNLFFTLTLILCLILILKQLKLR